MKNQYSIRFFIITMCITLLMLSCKKEQPQLPSPIGIIQDIDSNFYNYAEIQGDKWMIQNLNTSRFRNGDTILRVRTAEEWEEAYTVGLPAWMYYNNDSLIGQKYGKLYNWYAVNDQRGISPKGWHVATKEEWVHLRDSYGGSWNAGLHLKSESEDWLDDFAGINDSRFSALPGGRITWSGNSSGFGGEVWIWTSTIETPNTPFSNYAALMPGVNSVLNITPHDWDEGAYIRCVKD